MLKNGDSSLFNGKVGSTQLLFIALALLILIGLVFFIVRSLRKRREYDEDIFEDDTIPEPVNTSTNIQPESTKGGINALINSLNDIVFEFDENKTCHHVWFNKTRNWTVDINSFCGKTVTEAVGAENAAAMNTALDQIIAGRESVTIEFPSFLGSGKWFRGKSSRVFDDKGNYIRRIVTTVTDITQEKNLMIASAENEIRLMQAQAIAKVGDWWFDNSTYETHWSANLFAILEVDNLSENTKFDFYMKQVHEDDKELVARYFKKLVTTSTTIEHRIYTAKGNLKYVKVMKGRTITSADGKSRQITGIVQDISEARLAEKTIKKSRAELLEAQTIAKIGNWKWNFIEKRLTCSDEIHNIYEIYQPVGVVSKPFKLLLSSVHRDDRPSFKTFLRKQVTEPGTSFTCRINTPSGQVKYISIIIGKRILLDDGSLRNIIGTLQDVTERRQAEIAHQTTEDKYKLVLETVKLAAITLDKDGRITFCNKYLANLLGYTQAELIGKNWYTNFIPKNLTDMFDSWYKNQAVQSQFVNPVICRNGEQRVISWQNTVSFDANGNIRETTSIGEDVTEQQKDRQSLISAKEDAEKSSRFKSEFLSSMSHEIRTPMNAVIGITDLLISENPKPEQLAYLDTLKFSGESLLGIINDILDYNKIEAGKLSLNIHPFNIHQLLANVRQSFQVRANGKGIAINLLIDQTIPFSLKGDILRLSQILNNLVSNAIKFTERGSVDLTVKEKGRTAQQVILDFIVSDTGIGIAKESLDRIFDPFTQEEQTINYGGSGLGLAITKRLVQLHKSEINIASELNKGTRFSFTIAFDIDVQEQPKKEEPARPAAGLNLKGMRVLVVDDNQMNVLIACRFLKRWQVETGEASNGQMAVDMFKGNKYDLIIMDLQMPVMDGLEATRQIKAINPNMPIIALTADAMPETYNKAIETGMNDYLTKPFKQEVLFEKVSRFYQDPVMNN